MSGAVEHNAPGDLPVDPLVGGPLRGFGSIPARIRTWTGSVPSIVWRIMFVHMVLLAGYSIALPTYRAADEANHVDVVRVIAHGHGYPDYNDRKTDPALLKSVQLIKINRHSHHLLRSEAIPRDQRPAINDFGANGPTGSNQIVQHPPLYYGVVGTEYRIVHALLPGNPMRAFDREIGALRLLSALFVLPLPLFIWLATRRLRLSLAPSIAATMLPLALPQLQHLGASVNNDTMFILVSAALTLTTVHIATGDTRKRTIAMGGALTGLALFTKAFAFVYPAWLVLAVIAGRRTKHTRPSATDLGIAAGMSFAFGGWWWFRNLVKFGEISPSVEFANRLDRVRAGFHPDWALWLKEAFRRVGKTFFGNFGWYDVWIPVGVMIVGWMLIAVVVAIAFSRRINRDDASQPGERNHIALPSLWVTTVLFAPFALLGVFVFANAARLYAHSSQLVLLQGRYLFGGLAGLGALAAIALCSVERRAPWLMRYAPAGAFVAIVVMHAFAARAILGYYWGSATDGVGAQLRTLIAWSPWPVWCVAIGTAVGAIAIVLLSAAIVTNLQATSIMSHRDPQ